MFQFLPAITKLYRKLVQNPIPKTIPYMWYNNNINIIILLYYYYTRNTSHMLTPMSFQLAG